MTTQVKHPLSAGLEPAGIRELIKLLEMMRERYETLLRLTRAKTDAMERVDLAAMRELDGREERLVRQLQEREGFRRQLMDKIGSSLGLSSQAARALSVSQLADRFSEPFRSNLLKAATELRAVTTRSVQANRMMGVVSREIINHLGWVFASVRPAESRPAAYTGDGAPVRFSNTRIFEAVG